MKIGYCRISTKEQNFNLQENALQKEECEKIYYDVVSGAKAKRKGLDEMLSHLRDGDIVVIYKIDRLGRSLRHLVELINTLSESGIGLKILNDPVDTISGQGRLVTNIFASIAEFERELIQDRTNAGLAAASPRGRLGGRKPGLSKSAISKAIIDLLKK